MSLSARLSQYFAPEVRSRGQEYYWKGRARIKLGDDSNLEAEVRGSELYDVSLDWYEDGELDFWCDCSYFESTGPCKHLWAVVLAAESKGLLSKVARATAVHVDVGPMPEPTKLTEPVSKPEPVPDWQKLVSGMSGVQAHPELSPRKWQEKRQILYVVEVPASINASELVLWLAARDRKKDGTFSAPVNLSLRRDEIAGLPMAEDREILSALAGGVQYYGWGSTGLALTISPNHLVAHPLAGMILPLAIRTGRCFLRLSRTDFDLRPLEWDGGEPWRFNLEMRARERTGWIVKGVLRRGDERLPLSDALLVTPGGLVFTEGRVARLAEDAPFDWISNLRRTGAIEAPERDGPELLASLLTAAGAPPVDPPEELPYEEVTGEPRPKLKIMGPDQRVVVKKLRGQLSFDYSGHVIPWVEKRAGVYDSEARRLVRRNANTEAKATELLKELGFKFQDQMWREPAWDLPPTKLPRAVRTLVEAGWHIEAEGKIFKRPGAFKMGVSSGVDWFELHGEIEYGETTARLPELLEAVRKGDNLVRLGDGSYGVLPEEWLRKVGLLVRLGAPEDGHVRFQRSQAGLLDALLAAQPETTYDEAFARVREEMRQFDGIEAAAQPAGFVGTLRDYQREGLGWMEFLRRFSFGGCLADDMGVGKTAQVLALLEMRRALRAAGESVPPSLVVVPRSLVFNWKEESARFTPQLKIRDHTGLGRSEDGFGDCDVVLTTYGTLRRDAAMMKDVEFDYIVLDEAQSIKNATTENAKAVRLLRGAHRLALSGTPVENHLGELWSLFEFLNPGMLGAASVFKLAGNAARNPDDETRRLLAHALRPFILRRTKEQVARELPEKTEQTIYCEMEPEQRKLYNELRQHYRNALLKRIETDGLAKSKMMLLEALLRLRQAACHPGLIDAKRAEEPSAKLDTLLEQLREVMDEGHKALVFSQFTSLLAIVRERLDQDGVNYEYLDGSTRDRQSPVERFQNDPDCRLFLVSLKAGGLGLNLTAAEYVFLLDPWWNPAVEAQAIDRAHRIGQTRQVFAYRLIARDTVEEKVLELQKTKRDLAAAIIGADNSLIRNLKREDLELLLS
jgi:superfamily II DNA or RNA helicase